MKHIFIFIVSVAIAGCGGSGSGEEPLVTTPDTSSNIIEGKIIPEPQNPTLRLISGSGHITHDIKVNNGSYYLEADFPAGEYTLELQHGGLAEFDGTVSKLGSLQLKINHNGSHTAADITPFSALAKTTDNRNLANWLNLDSFDSFATADERALYQLEINALSLLAKNHFQSDTQSLYELMLADLLADSVLDGIGQFNQALSLNGYSVTEGTYRADFAQSFIVASKSDLNMSSYTGVKAVAMANQIANSDSSSLPFLADPIVVIDESELSTFQVSISEGEIIYGHYQIDFTTPNPHKINSLVIESSNTELASISVSATAHSFMIDTYTLEDGEHELTVRAELESGLTTTQLVRVNVNNTTAFVTLASAESTSSANYTFSVNLGGRKDGLESVLINGQEASAMGDTYSMNTFLQSGVNSITVSLNFESEPQVINTFTVTLDNQPPSVDQIYHEYVTGYQVNYFRTADDVTEKRYLTMDSSYPFFITHGSASLNGLAPTVQNLMDNGYSFYQGKINDHYTDHSDLTVKYSVSLDGSVISENVNLQIDEQGIFVIPLTTEYLSQNLKTVTFSNQYTIIVEATDEANNTTTKQYGFYVKFAEYSISPSKIYDEDAVVSGNITYSPEGFFTDAVRVTLISGENRYDAIDPTNPSFSLASSALGSGDVSFTIEVETSFGTTYSEVISLNVDNVSPTVNTELNVEATGGTHTFNGTVSDDYGISSLKLDGEYLAFDNSTGQFEFTKTLNSGTQFFQIEALDFSGNATRISVQANYDPNRPEFGLVSPLSGNQKLWATMAGGGTQKINFQLSESNTYLIYQGNASFSGLSETVNNLNNNSIPYVEFTAKDKLVNGSFVNPVVSYELSKNGGVVKAATVLAPKTGYSYILPLTTEYLGAHLTTAIASDFYSLKIIMTNDGDTREVSFNLKFKASVTSITNSWTAEKVFSDTTPSAVLLGNDIAGLTESKLTINGTDYFAADPNILSFNPDLTALNDGLHSAVLSLSDRLGVTHTENMSFNLDTTAPTFTHNLPEMTDVYDFTVNGIVIDNISGVSRLQIDGNDVMFDSITGAFTYDIEIDSAAGLQQNVKNYDSSHEFILTDLSGNTTTYNETIIVDRMGAFIWNQGSHVDGLLDISCDGTPGSAQTWYGGTSETNWIVYADTKSLNGTDINDDAELQSKSIAYFRFWTWAHVYEHFDMLSVLTDVKYSYDVNNQLIFSDRALNSISLAGFKNVNEFRIALTEEYLGVDFYKTANNDIHKVTVKVEDMLGFGFEQEYRFKICNYVDLGINKQ